MVFNNCDSRWKWTSLILVVVLTLANPIVAAKKAPTPAAAAPPSTPPAKEESVIEEVSAKQLERVLNEKDYVAVFWYTRSCHTCDKVLLELEKIDDDTDNFGVDFVKINDKRLAKHYGIKNFPALTYFREKEPIIYEGDLMDEENVLDFLTSLEAMDLPDRIEEVNSRILGKIVEDSPYVAVLFCPNAETCPTTGAGSIKPACKKCSKALQELENIDDEADQLGIGFVKIQDEDLAEEYNLGELPRLVYYRHQIPIIYENELTREEDVLEWLVQNKSTGDEEDVIEDVTAKSLNTLIGNIDNLVVLFYDNDDDDSMQVLSELEKIDDDCDKQGIQFVKIDDAAAAKEFGIDNIPALVYFEKEIPNVYDGDLENEDEILEWLVSQLESDEIEDVTDEMLDKMIKEGKTLAVLFYDNNDRKSQRVLNELENIDDECDKHGIIFVKIDNPEEAAEYGIEKVPSLIYFEKGIPLIYEGSLEEEEQVLKWLEHQQHSDEIEDVTDEMLDMLIDKLPNVAVLFYDKEEKTSQKVLSELENIDDDCDKNNIAFVKIDNDAEAHEYGIDQIPTLVYFERRIPHVYDGDLTKEDELLKWLIRQKKHSEIPEITNEMMDKILEKTPYLAVLFYNKEDKQDLRVLNELENIDDDLDKEDIIMVRMDDKDTYKQFGIDDLPTLVYFENRLPAIYEGDLLNENEVLDWLIEQKSSATIEEVTDEILQDLISEHEYVVVYFSGPCAEEDEDQECENILGELENIDDELDEAGIIFVTTEDTALSKKHGVKDYPALVFFRNKMPLFFKGDIEDEDEVLAWITDEETLEIPGRIEEVNSKMLDKIISERSLVVVFFYVEGDKKSQKIIQELENIDDECEEKDITFVKTSDENIQKEYDLPSLPSLVFYRNKFRTIYQGDLMQEEAILEWVLELYEKTPDVIESVDRKTLQVLINDVEHLAVFFYDDSDKCREVLDELETIDDDTDKHGIQFVKSKDSKLASEIGIFSFPALVYYETGVPIMYDGNLKDEDKVLAWLVEQKSAENDDELSEEEIIRDYFEDQDGIRKITSSEGFFTLWKRKLASKVWSSEGDDDAIDDNNDDEVIDDGEEEEEDDDDDDEEEYDDEVIDDDDDDEVIDDDDDEVIDDDDDEVIDDDDDEVIDDDDGGEYDGNDKKIDGVKDNEANDNNKVRENVNLSSKFKDKLNKGIDHKIEVNPKFAPAQPKPEKSKFKILPSSLKKINDKKVLDNFQENKKKADYSNENNDDDVSNENDDGDDVQTKKRDGKFIKASRFASTIEKSLPRNRQVGTVLSRKRKRKASKSVQLCNDDECDDDMSEENEDDVVDDDDEMSEENDDDVDDEMSEENVEIGDDGDNSEVEGNNDDDESDDGDDNYEQEESYNIYSLLKVFNLIGRDVEITSPALNEDATCADQCQGDGCFIIGLGGKSVIPKVSYEPYQCCPTKLKKNTKIPRATKEPAADKKTKKKNKDTSEEKSNLKTEKLLKKPEPLPKVSALLPAKPEKVPLTKAGKKKNFASGGNLLDESNVLDWMIAQKMDESIPDIDRETLYEYIEIKEFLAVVWYDEEDAESPRILRHIELIDDEASEYGIKIVKCKDKLMAKKYGYRKTPGITYFRKGKYINYDGDIDDDEEILDWLTHPENMELTDHIERVNRRMFLKIRQTSDYTAVFFYSDECKQCDRVLAEIEHIDDEADGAGIKFVKINDKVMAKEIGVFALPAVAFFKLGSKEPVIYAGDLYDEEQILNWLMTQKDPSGDAIEALEGDDLRAIIEDSDSLAIYFWNQTLCELCNNKIFRKMMAKKSAHHEGAGAENEGEDDDTAVDECEQCQSVMEELENIDDDCDRHGIAFVKTQDFDVAKEFGVSEFPSLVYFEKGIPNVFEGDLMEEEEVLQWLITQRTEDRIELVTRIMLEAMVEETQYLAVYFYKLNCHICDELLEGLEHIDDECDVFGIHMVKIQDPPLAKRYGIKTFPALVYFRNGNPLLYEGDLQNEEAVLEWLVDDDNRELADEIEQVNNRMLERLLDESHFLAVIFYDEEDSSECDEILEALETIDGEADLFGIDMVKISDQEVSTKYGIANTPTLVYFTKRNPLVYDGDMADAEKVLTWLTSLDVFDNKNEIEEVNRKLLDKLLEEHEFLAVYFYELDHPESERVTERLENIDGEIDNIDIIFVKMADPRYARKWGVTKLPSIVFFRKRFPSIYRGELHSEEEVLEWLRKNRYRGPELGIFMYILIAVVLAFILYTLFLLNFFKRDNQS